MYGAIDDQDETLDLTTATQVFYDADQDGFGDPARSQQSCVAPEGYITNDTDCDDEQADLYPNAPGFDEVCKPLPLLEDMMLDTEPRDSNMSQESVNDAGCSSRGASQAPISILGLLLIYGYRRLRSIYG